MAVRKVGLVVPTLGTIDVEVVSRLFFLHRPLNAVVAPCWPVGMDTATARNVAIQALLDDGCTHAFFLDYDVVIPAETLTVLAAHDVPIACGLYYTKTKPPEPITIIRKGDEHETVQDWEHGDVITVDVTGLGCALIDLSIFADLERPWFQSGHSEATGRYTEDAWFYRHLEKQTGIKPIVDTGLCCVHKDLKTQERYYLDAETGLPTWEDAEGKHTMDDRRVIDLTKGSEDIEATSGEPAATGDTGPAD